MTSSLISTPYPPATWRLLLSPFADGAANMAVDEAILNAIAAGRSSPTLRVFGWTPPCLSLGYAQPMADVDMDRLTARGWGLVRRPTGGRAILHTDELTYSVIAPMDEPRVLGGVIESYRQLSAALMRGVEVLGLQAQANKKTDDGHPTTDSRPATNASSAETAVVRRLPSTVNPICFEVPSDYEITANGKKLLGSAQVRRRGVVLQHGTLPLAGDLGRIGDALFFDSEAEREQAKARVRERATTVAEVLGAEVDWAQAAAALRQGFAEALNLTLAEQPLSDFELGEVRRLREEKYAARGWNERL